MGKGITKAAKAKEELHAYSEPEDVAAWLKSQLPDGVPIMGIRGDEAADYVRDFVMFRESILQGDLHGDRHFWGVIDSRPDALLVVENEDEEEDTVELDPEGRTVLLRAFQAGTLELKPKGDPFIIDDAFIIRAWTIGVIRHGFNFYGGDNYNTDEAMQIAHWGYVNQG